MKRLALLILLLLVCLAPATAVNVLCSHGLRIEVPSGLHYDAGLSDSSVDVYRDTEEGYIVAIGTQKADKVSAYSLSVALACHAAASKGMDMTPSMLPQTCVLAGGAKFYAVDDAGQKRLYAAVAKPDGADIAVLMFIGDFSRDNALKALKTISFY